MSVDTSASRNQLLLATSSKTDTVAQKDAAIANPPASVVNTVFNVQKLTSREDFMDWLKWLSISTNSFQEGFDFKKILIDSLVNEARCIIYATEMLIKFLVLQSVDNLLIPDIYGTHIAATLNDLATHYGLITTTAQLEQMNADFTFDYNVPRDVKLKEWDLLEFMNALNLYHDGDYTVKTNLCVYANKHNLANIQLESSISDSITAFYDHYDKKASVPKPEPILHNSSHSKTNNVRQDTLQPPHIVSDTNKVTKPESKKKKKTSADRKLSKERKKLVKTQRKQAEKEQIRLQNISNELCKPVNTTKPTSTKNNVSNNPKFKSNELSFKPSETSPKLEEVSFKLTENKEPDILSNLSNNAPMAGKTMNKPPVKSICAHCGGPHKTNNCKNLPVCKLCHTQHAPHENACPVWKSYHKVIPKKTLP